MKMENVLSAPTDGIISEILVTSGKNVNKGQVLVRLD
jgi:biotin carboxyl carrier protein